MSSAAQTSSGNNTDLAGTVASTLALLQNLTKSLERAERALQPVPQDSPDPLDVLHTAATLLKAHTTKLSLLIINKPFTPSALRKVISDVASTCVPAMMSAVQICQPSSYGQILHDEVKVHVGRIYKELEHMMQELQYKLGSMSDEKKSNDSSSRDSLASTGVIWETCDQLIELKNLGLAGLVVRKALLYKSMLEDAMNELQECAEDNDSDDDEAKAEAVAQNSDSVNSVEELFGAGSSIPKDRPDLRETLGLALRKLKQIKSLYNSLVKYRLKTVSTKTVQNSPGPGDTLTEVMDHLRRIPEQVDELAGSFYELDNDEAHKLITAICKSGKDATELMKVSWTNDEDEFTTWAGFWLRLIDQA